MVVSRDGSEVIIIYVYIYNIYNNRRFNLHEVLTKKLTKKLIILERGVVRRIYKILGIYIGNSQDR